MPMKNYHSCRLKPPNYEEYAYEECKIKHEGKCIDFVYGIKGPNESELQAMRYSKKIWTEADARAHCKDNDGTFEPAEKDEKKERAFNMQVRKAIPIHHTGTSSGAWDGPGNEARLKNDETASYYRKAYAWVDPDGDPDTKSAYKFIHHEVSGDGAIGAANTKGCIATIAVLNGARGGTDIPDADRKGVWNHVAAHLKDAEIEPPELKSYEDDVERRYLPIQEMRASKTDDGKMLIEGYPIVYEKYANLWGFREIIRKGAATEALKRSDEMVLWDHETDQPMARKKNGTLEVKEDEKGVFIKADVSKTFWGRNGYEAILNGIVDRMSFAFTIARAGDNWHWDEFEGIKIEVREIIKLQEIFDYSPVSYPAYKQTVVNARSKELALRNRPDPGTPGEAGGTPPEVPKESRDNIRRMRDSIKEELKL